VATAKDHELPLPSITSLEEKGCRHIGVRHIKK
jgi:hypothetical protein